MRTTKQSSTGIKSHDLDTDNQLQHLSKGQAFGEMALLMNYQRTANARAITHVELCVLSHVDFQHILVKHPDDRKKVMAATLGACMAHNEANAVFCPLKEIAQSVYNDRSPESTASIQADEAVPLIMVVINPGQNDPSIRFGVNTGLRQQLVDKRDRDSQHTNDSRATTHRSHVTTAREAQATPEPDGTAGA